MSKENKLGEMDHLMHQVHHYLDKAATSQWQNQNLGGPQIDDILICRIRTPSKSLLIVVLITSAVPIITGIFGFIVSTNLRKQQTVK